MWLREVSAVFWLPQKATMFWLSEELSASKVGIWSMELATMKLATMELVKSVREMTNDI
jgi:hypothetical protein